MCDIAHCLLRAEIHHSYPPRTAPLSLCECLPGDRYGRHSHNDDYTGKNWVRPVVDALQGNKKLYTKITMSHSPATLDDLAVMIAKGFAGVDERLDAIESRLTAVENFARSTDERLDRVQDNLRELTTTVERVESTIIADNVRRIGVLEERVNALHAA